MKPSAERAIPAFSADILPRNSAFFSPPRTKEQFTLHAAEEALSFIDANTDRYGITWKNKGRISINNWKTKIYQQAINGRQIAIYNRVKQILLRVEYPVTGIPGVEESHCPTSDALNLSKFKDGTGICYVVANVFVLEQFLNEYFGVIELETIDDVENSFNHQLAEARSRSTKERQARLKNAPQKPRQVTVQSTVFIRNPDVVLEVLTRAAGKCEWCKSDAPFLKASTGEPYLEVHHRIRLADGGEDTVANAIALCPNCHRKMHFG